ncbi:SU10 major capsid protein [Microbacterium sp. MMO-56]|uniref:SU10 major capsid protein n=2 Tax=Microbacterium TaxID=33882 RepID=UPI003017C9EC
MAGITGQGTNYNLPNFVGELFQVSPSETPLLSAIGGLTGGEEVKSVEFEWQEEDLRDSQENRTRLEGANAQNSDQRVRRNVKNVVEIHQETVEVSYTKQAATGQTSGVNNDQTNPVTNELDHQLELALKAKAVDIELSFILGRKFVPTDNTQARRTGGLIEAISTNVIDLGTSYTGLSATTDTIAQVATPLANGDAVRFTSVGVSTGVRLDRVYYVVSKATDSFKVGATKGGAPITIGTATVAVSKLTTAGPVKDTYDALFEKVFQSGGLGDDTATIIVGARQKRSLSTAYAKAFGQYQEESRNVGGVNFTTIMSDFGTFNVLLDRWMPADAFMVSTLSQLKPKFLVTPGKGHFFSEPLAKIGASDREQLYGEVGLQWGNERAHGIIRGLPVEPVWA